MMRFLLVFFSVLVATEEFGWPFEWPFGWTTWTLDHRNVTDHNSSDGATLTYYNSNFTNNTGPICNFTNCTKPTTKGFKWPFSKWPFFGWSKTWTLDHTIDHNPSRGEVPYYNISNFTFCIGLTTRDMGINAGIAIYTPWKFCCDCAQKAISAYKREVLLNRYHLIVTPCYLEDIWEAVEKIVKKEFKKLLENKSETERKRIVAERMKTIRIGCAHYVNWIGFQSAVCLLPKYQPCQPL